MRSFSFQIKSLQSLIIAYNTDEVAKNSKLEISDAIYGENLIK